MAAALERKLARIAGKDPRDMQTLAEEAAKAKAATEEDWDVEGRMTPGRMTPREGNAEIAKQALEMTGSEEAAVAWLNAEIANQALANAHDRRRRSSAAKKHTSTIALAMEQAKGRRRRSLAKKYGMPVEDAISEAMEHARGRHRKSISKAADILESAGYDGENVTFDDASSKMKLVEQAMADARQRHRRSVDRAMMQLEESPLPPAHLNAWANEFTPQQQQHAQTSSFNTGAQEFTPQQQVQNWHADVYGQCESMQTNEWNTPISFIQDRISSAVSTAYQTYEQNYDQYDQSRAGYDQYGCSQQRYAGGYSQGCDSQMSCGQQWAMQEQGYGQQQCYGQTQQVYDQSYQQCQQQQSYDQSYQYGQNCHSYQQGSHLDNGQWQCGNEAGAWDTNMYSKEAAGWDNQQTYTSPWRLGSA